MLKYFQCFVLALFIIVSARESYAQPEPRHVDLVVPHSWTNIVLIMADDLGYECIGVNGGTSYQTPVLDKLAETGMRFEHCHSTPLCTPSRVQLMTGMNNIHNYTNFGVLERTQITFAHLFRDAGYATCIAGKWQLGKETDSPGYFGFDEYLLWQHTLGRTDEHKHDTRFSNPFLEGKGGPVRYTGGAYGPDLVSDFLCDFIERNKDTPFFAYYPMILTHCPFTPTPDSEDWDPEDMGSLDYKGDPDYFGDMVTYMDKLVGKIVNELEEHNLRDNTLILFTGDNGTDQPVVSMLDGREVPGGKSHTSDNGTHVPLIANWKGVIQPGQVCHDLVDFSDFLPTLCQAAHIDLPGNLPLDGRSFFPQLMGQPGDPREWIYSWYCPRRKNLKEWARNKQYKLYRSGEFFHVENDFLEENPLNADHLDTVAERFYTMLSDVLDQYKNVR
jgi:arylsulfatase A